jgi:oligopeptide/dipeptide ABC transporter ATP-binding protein
MAGMSGVTGMPALDDLVLDIQGLAVEYRSRGAVLRALPGIDLEVRRGEVLGLVGESGSGKSTLALAVLGLLPANGSVAGGRILLNGRADLATMGREELRRTRGSKIAMIFQDPLTSLNPTFKIGHQMVDAQAAHSSHRAGQRDRRQFRERAVTLLRQVGLPDPVHVAGSYPYQLSGGMRQRVMIATALSLEPELLIADEPTSALDVTTEAQILDLLRQIKAGRDLTILFVTHDLSVVAEICDRVVVMYAGQIMEQGAVAEVFAQPQHPYTRALLDAIPARSHRGRPLTTIPGRVPSLLGEIRGCRFASRCGYVKEICREIEPRPVASAASEAVRCHRCDPESPYQQAPSDQEGRPGEGPAGDGPDSEGPVRDGPIHDSAVQGSTAGEQERVPPS